MWKRNRKTEKLLERRVNVTVAAIILLEKGNRPLINILCVCVCVSGISAL